MLLQALAAGGGDAGALQMINSALVRAHPRAVGAKGIASPGSWALARRRLDQDPPRTNAHGLPIGLTLTPGEGGDSTICAELMHERDSDPGILPVDRGHDNGATRQNVRDRGGQVEIPIKRNRCVQHGVQRPFHALRNRIERCISHPRNCCRVAPRYGRATSSFLGFVQLDASNHELTLPTQRSGTSDAGNLENMIY